MAFCRYCGGTVAHDARVCRHCRRILDRAAWRHDAGRLGGDGRGAGHPLEDPPVGPLPLTGNALAGFESVAAVAAGVARLLTAALLALPRKRG